MDRTPKIKKFDIMNIKPDKIICLIGPRGTGKSIVGKDIIFHLNNLINVATVVSGTERANGFYKEFIPDSFIYDEYSDGITERICERQLELSDKSKENELTEMEESFKRLLVVFDDCLYDDKWIKNKSMKYIFTNGRHILVTFLFMMQYPLGIPPPLRSNVDYTFILADSQISNRKKIYENYAGSVPDIHIFNKLMDLCTNEYGCLVIDNTVKDTDEWINHVFYYKSIFHNDFQFGHPLFWKMHNEWFDPQYVKKNKNSKKKSNNHLLLTKTA
jgi:hypothetical protein